MTEMAAFAITILGFGSLAGVGVAGLILMRRVLAPNPVIDHDVVTAPDPDRDPGRAERDAL